MKKLIVLTFLTAFLSVPTAVFAQEQTCVNFYGGGVICGAAAPEHEPVEAGLAENLALIGGGLILASGLFFYLSRKAITKVEERI